MSEDAAARTWRPPLQPVILFAALALVLILLAFGTPFNHDEDQYLAASVLASKARLYRDILYVQTPLYPELTAPLTGLVPGWSYLVLRLFSAACGLAALLGVSAAHRRLGVSRPVSQLSVLLMASCYIFQYASSVVRNDALPMALLAWAIVFACRALESGRWRLSLDWVFCGLLLGVAVSAKISYAPLLAVTGLVLTARWLRSPSGARLAQAVELGLGAGAGLSPIALAYVCAPEPVSFALAGFWATGPRQWYLANGLEQRLAPVSKLLYGLGDLALGPALAALVIVVFIRLRGRREAPSSPATGLLDLMIVAGLVAAFTPSPTFKQYFAPLLPPLFVRLGLAARNGWPRWGKLAMAAGAVTGAAVFCLKLGPAVWTGSWPAVVTARENRWMGDTLHQAGASGAIATLSAHAVADSGFPLDRRFAGGAMIYRSAEGFDPLFRRRLGIISPSSLTASLDAEQPAAIVTGYEPSGGDTRVDLDSGLRAYAQARGYVLHSSPWDAAQLYIRRDRSARVPR